MIAIETIGSHRDIKEFNGSVKAMARAPRKLGAFFFYPGPDTWVTLMYWTRTILPFEALCCILKLRNSEILEKAKNGLVGGLAVGKTNNSLHGVDNKLNNNIRSVCFYFVFYGWVWIWFAPKKPRFAFDDTIACLSVFIFILVSLAGNSKD